MSAELEEVARARSLLEAAVGRRFTDGNRIAIHRNGARIFPAMLSAIHGARTSIDFLTFVYWEGEITREFAAALAERARAGVRVRVLLDGYGARSIDDDLVSLMQDAGAEVAWFRPLERWNFWHIAHRTHRKILVCDRSVGFTGGVGIAEEWQGDARGPDEWRETQFEVEGDAVAGLLAGFLDNWLEATRSGFPDQGIETRTPGSTSIQVVCSSARDGWSDAATLLHTLIRLANRRLRIATAYFAPDPLALSELLAAVERGVEVEILVPGLHVDTRLSRLAGEDVFEALIEGGAQIWRYQPTMLHAKIITIDGYLAGVGSPNFNRRSMCKDDEIAMTILDRETVGALDSDFEADLERSDRVHLGEWRRRGVWQKFKELASRAFRTEV